MLCFACDAAARYAVSARRLNLKTAQLTELGKHLTCRDHLDAAWDAFEEQHTGEGTRIFVDRLPPPKAPLG